MRLFVQLVPPDEVRTALPALPPGVRGAPPGQEHVTLAFLGEVADPARVAAALDEALDGGAPPRLRLEGAGAFGTSLWLGLGGDRERLLRLAGVVQDAVRRAGVALEPRPYRPHLTLGRGRLPAGLAAYRGPDATWDRVDLVHSTLTSGRARHVPLRTWRLTGA